TRLAPAQFTWTGGANDGKWASGANWSNSVAPTVTDPGPDDLIFPPTSGTLILTNNIGTGSAPLKVNSVTFSGGGYSIGGNPLILGSTSATSGTGQLNVGAGMVETLNIGLTLGGGGSSQQNFNVGSTSVLNLNG